MSNDRCVELGFIEKVEPWKLKSKYFPCKVGGYPAWLNLEDLPKEKDLNCPKCEKQMIFLCQMYAPFTSKEDCFHRTIFVFICRDGSCSSENEANNIKVFRCQLPRENKFYAYEPPKATKEDSDSPLSNDFVKLCRVCGALGLKKCGACKLASYCSGDHQAKDWKAGHNKECKIKEIGTESPGSKDVLFPEYEIEVEAEDIECEKEKSDEQIYAEYEELLKKGQIPFNGHESEEEEEQTTKDLLKAAAKETDKQFAKFRTRISFDPDQILRYDRGHEPLWVSSENKPSDIPACQLCGSPRQFELQLMPQLLVHLKVDSLGQSIDWGTIIIYSCTESCSLKDQSYVQEVAYKQDYTPDTDFLRR